MLLSDICRNQLIPPLSVRGCPQHKWPPLTLKARRPPTVCSLLADGRSGRNRSMGVCPSALWLPLLGRAPGPGRVYTESRAGVPSLTALYQPELSHPEESARQLYHLSTAADARKYVARIVGAGHSEALGHDPHLSPPPLKGEERTLAFTVEIGRSRRRCKCHHSKGATRSMCFMS